MSAPQNDVSQKPDVPAKRQSFYERFIKPKIAILWRDSHQEHQRRSTGWRKQR